MQFTQVLLFHCLYGWPRSEQSDIKDGLMSVLGDAYVNLAAVCLIDAVDAQVRGLIE